MIILINSRSWFKSLMFNMLQPENNGTCHHFLSPTHGFPNGNCWTLLQGLACMHLRVYQSYQPNMASLKPVLDILRKDSWLVKVPLYRWHRNRLSPATSYNTTPSSWLPQNIDCRLGSISPIQQTKRHGTWWLSSSLPAWFWSIPGSTGQSNTTGEHGFL